MTISEYVRHLERIKREHGDLPVEDYDSYSGRGAAIKPEVAYRKVLRKRERKPRFWLDYEAQELKGEKVVRI